MDEAFEKHWNEQLAVSPVEFPPEVMARLKAGSKKDFQAGWEALQNLMATAKKELRDGDAEAGR